MGSGKWRAIGLLSYPEALEVPPGAQVRRRPLLTLVIGLGVVAAANRHGSWTTTRPDDLPR